MTLHPDTYGVRSGLVPQVLRAFWTTRWKGAPEPEYVVLGGSHGEGAVVNVTLDEKLSGRSARCRCCHRASTACRCS
jgi:hypothetical protein